jgi:hypothetical protein
MSPGCRNGLSAKPLASGESAMPTNRVVAANATASTPRAAAGERRRKPVGFKDERMRTIPTHWCNKKIPAGQPPKEV